MATSAHDIAALIAAASPDELDALAQRYADDPRKQVARALERALKARDALAAEEVRSTTSSASWAGTVSSSEWTRWDAVPSRGRSPYAPSPFPTSRSSSD